MDWDYESDETDPDIIFSAPIYINHEEIEFQASNESDLTITVESMIRDSLDVGEMDDTCALGEGSRRRLLMEVFNEMQAGKII